ncbi:hypothetical protein L596_021871 [Steinernema carpocapsae]|uniref:OTU domain-containing protein n=1 Tax=Steinernema carpocapsae TaxID=34508 RepID=A0A4U5MK55_STECR|nr:hypothetical protein L596_021871 [Steinernema carpocapsae]
MLSQVRPWIHRARDGSKTEPEFQASPVFLTMPARIDWENAGVKKIINEDRSKKLSHRDAAQLLSPIVGYHVSHATIGKFLRRKNNNRFGVHANPSVVGRARGDGHCGFRSFAQCIFGPGNDEHIYLALRKHICDYLLKAPYPIWYEIFKPRISMIMHLEKMRTNAWMTSLELQAAATLLDITFRSSPPTSVAHVG